LSIGEITEVAEHDEGMETRCQYYMQYLSTDERAWLSSHNVEVQHYCECVSRVECSFGYYLYWGYIWSWRRTFDHHVFAKLTLTTFPNGKFTGLWVDDGSDDIVPLDNEILMTTKWTKAIARNYY